MLPATWKSPPCMNIEVKIVRIGDGKSTGADGRRRSAGTGPAPNSSMKACAGPRALPVPTSSETW